MKIERYGDVIIVEEFWDCECDDDYIHRKTQGVCSICKAHKDEMPDSRLPEILWEVKDLDKWEIMELVGFILP